MSFGGKSFTKAESARADKVKAGHCVACLQRGVDVSGQGLVQLHHLLSGGRRIGHMATIGLCCWHHMGQPFWGCSLDEMREAYGPALSEGSKPFHAAFGPDVELLGMQEELLRGMA